MVLRVSSYRHDFVQNGFDFLPCFFFFYVSLNLLFGKRRQTSFQKLWFHPFFGLDILGDSECRGPYLIMMLKARGKNRVLFTFKHKTSYTLGHHSPTELDSQPSFYLLF